MQDRLCLSCDHCERKCQLHGCCDSDTCCDDESISRPQGTGQFIEMISNVRCEVWGVRPHNPHEPVITLPLSTDWLTVIWKEDICHEKIPCQVWTRSWLPRLSSCLHLNTFEVIYYDTLVRFLHFNICNLRQRDILICKLDFQTRGVTAALLTNMWSLW